MNARPFTKSVLWTWLGLHRSKAIGDALHSMQSVSPDAEDLNF